MDLNYKLKTFKVVDYHDFEKFVEERLNLPGFSFVNTVECSNDSSHEFHIDDLPLSDYDQEVVGLYKEGKTPSYGYFISDIFTVLKAGGHLEPGYYLIDVCW